MAIIYYEASDMILLIHENDSYLSVSCAHSLAGGHHYLRNNSDDPPNNQTINTSSKIVVNVMGSADEAEIYSTYINAQYFVPLQTCHIEMVHPKPPHRAQNLQHH